MYRPFPTLFIYISASSVNCWWVMMMTGSVVITLPLFFMFRGFPPSPKPLHKHLLLVIYTCTRWQATPTYIACIRLPVTYRLESKIEKLKQKQNRSCVFFRLKVRFWQDGWVGNITFDINFEPQTFSHYHLLDISVLFKKCSTDIKWKCSNRNL